MTKTNNNKNKKAAWITAGLLILVLVMIFLFSSQKAEDSSRLSSRVVDFLIRYFYPEYDSLTWKEKAPILSRVSYIVRKTAHFMEYALLAALLTLHLHFAVGKYRFPAAVGFAFLYACTDEFHQLFTDGRAGRFKDVLIDTSGAAAGALFLLLMILLVQSIAAKKAAKAGAAPDLPSETDSGTEEKKE